MTASTDPVRQVSVGESQYHKKKIQPWDIWEEYELNPWDADIIKRVLRNKHGQAILDYEKIKHICDERIRQLRCESALETQEEKTPLVTSDGRAEYLEKMRADVREACREPGVKPRNTFANKGTAT